MQIVFLTPEYHFTLWQAPKGNQGILMQVALISLPGKHRAGSRPTLGPNLFPADCLSLDKSPPLSEIRTFDSMAFKLHSSSESS